MLRGRAPVGIEYEDGQCWDDTTSKLPEACVSIEASLIYEPLTMEYIKFHAEENQTDDLGKTLLNVWRNAGDATAAVIATVKAAP